MKKQIRVTMLIIGVILIMAVPTSVETVNAQPKKATDLPSEIKIGGVFPVVKRPDAGRDRRDGFLMAIAEINNQTGAERILPEGVMLVSNWQDDNNDAAGGTAAAQALIAWGADIVIGSSGSTVSMAIATELTPHKIPQISYASSSPALEDRVKYPYFMRNAASDSWQGTAVADLVDAFGWEEGAIIATSDAYGTGLCDIFKAGFEDAGGKILTYQKFDPGAAEADTQIQAIKDKDPQFILGNFIDEDAATAMKSASDLGLTEIPWITTDGWSTTATLGKGADVKAAMQLSIGTNPAPMEGVKYGEFNSSWFDPAWAYLEGPKLSQDTDVAFNSYAPLAYDAVYIAAYGLAAANTTEGEALLAALYDVEFEGAGGSIYFDDKGEVTGRYDYVQCEGDAFTKFGEWQTTAALSAGTITLADDSEWEIKDNKAECQKNCPEEEDEGIPGFTGIEVFVFLGLAAVALVIYGRKA